MSEFKADPTFQFRSDSVTRNPIGFHRTAGSDGIRLVPTSDWWTWVTSKLCYEFINLPDFRQFDVENGPFAIYLDLTSNSLIIANRGVNNIVKWVLGASTWTLLVGSGSGSSGSSSTLLNGPCGVILDPLGNIYVADTSNHRIQFFRKGQTNGTTVAGVTGVSGSTDLLLSGPYAIRLDIDNSLYVADTNNQRIQKFTSY